MTLTAALSRGGAPGRTPNGPPEARAARSAS